MDWKHISISNLTDEEYAYGFSLMNTKKQEKVTKLLFEDDKKRTVAGELLARKMISAHTGISVEDISFAIGKNGKPYLPNGEMEFNISHSADIAVCCVDKNPVGIDVEKIRPVTPSILKRVCTGNDFDYITGGYAPKELSEEQLYRFFEVWTAKEAYLKRIGSGIGDLKTVSFEQIKSSVLHFDSENYHISISVE